MIPESNPHDSNLELSRQSRRYPNPEGKTDFAYTAALQYRSLLQQNTEEGIYLRVEGAAFTMCAPSGGTGAPFPSSAPSQTCPQRQRRGPTVRQAQTARARSAPHRSRPPSRHPHGDAHTGGGREKRRSTARACLSTSGATWRGE